MAARVGTHARNYSPAAGVLFKWKTLRSKNGTDYFAAGKRNVDPSVFGQGDADLVLKESLENCLKQQHANRPLVVFQTHEF